MLMTGAEFQEGMQRLGLTQAALARALGVHRTTIAERCSMDQVDPLYRAAILGLLAEHAVSLLVAAVGKTDVDIPRKSE